MMCKDDINKVMASLGRRWGLEGSFAVVLGLTATGQSDLPTLKTLNEYLLI